MAEATYSLLKHQEDQDDTYEQPPPRQHLLAVNKKIIALALGFVASVCLNIVFVALWATQQAASSPDHHVKVTGDYANLELDQPVPRTDSWDSPYMDAAAWDEADYEGVQGVVALSDSWTVSKGLPTAQRWPWDEHKGIYVLNGFHNIHCVRSLQRSVVAGHSGVEHSRFRSHLMHCLNSLREEVLCQADDTPLYTGLLHAQKNDRLSSSGTGQVRMCRDWRKLEAFARENSACYRPSNGSNPDMTESDRYKFCPDGQVFWD